MDDPYRGTGRTAEQIRAAPRDSVFVWCSAQLEYPQRIRNDLGRSDVRVVSPSFIARDRLRGFSRPVVVDHAVNLTPEQSNVLREHEQLQARR